jgi:protein O-GlcNAc transferase
LNFSNFNRDEVIWRFIGGIDIGLDTLPYNGHTTSLDSFWMRVPVVSRVGATVVGRAGWSQLSNLDMRELAAQSDERYVNTVVQLAENPRRVAELRAGLRERMKRSPLMNGGNFARNIEGAYRKMWGDYCDRKGD